MCNRCQLRDEIESGRDIEQIPNDSLTELTVDFDPCFNYNYDQEAKVYFMVVNEINRRANLKNKQIERKM